MACKKPLQSNSLTGIVNETMDNKSLWKFCQVTKSSADGHCLLHSVVSSLKLQLRPRVELSSTQLLEIIYDEITSHLDKYTYAVDNNDRRALFYGYHMYASYKIYDTDFGDLVTSFICNALNICLVIVTEDTNGNLSVHFEKNHKGITPLFLHKVSKHYNALSPLDIIYLWHPGRAHITDSCADDVIPFSKSGTCADDNVSATLYDDETSSEDFLYHMQKHRISHPTNLIIGSFNINSVRHKFSTVNHILGNGYLDIFGLSETKIDQTFPDGQFHIENYMCHRKDRTCKGGGLMFYVRSDIPQRRRVDLESKIDSRNSGIEIIILETVLHNKERCIYVLGYKPPNINDSTFLDVFCLMGDIVMNESENIVIIGDYNCDFMVDNALQDACVSFDLHNLVTSPTCQKSCNGSFIDLCLVSKPLRFKKALNLYCWLSDFHNIVCITTKLSLPKRSPNVISYRTLKNFNDDAFVYDLFQLSEAMVYCNRDINWCMQYFSTCLYDIKKKTIRQNSVPYMNSELRKLNYQRNMMRNLKN